MTDREMIKAMNMNERTFYWYKNKMYEHYGNIQQNKTEDTIYAQQQLLSERLTKLYKLSELKLTGDRAKMSGMEIEAVVSVAQKLAINILKLECEGLRSCNRNINRVTQQYTTKELNVIDS